MVDFSSFVERLDLKSVGEKIKQTDTRVFVAGGVSVVAVCTFAYYQLKPKKKKKVEALKEEDLKGKQFTKLLNAEKAMIGMSIPPCNSLSWFRGDFESGVKYLETRVNDICKANMWLSARHKEVESHGVCWIYDDSTDGIFNVLSREESCISRSTSLSELYKLCTPYMVKSGKAEDEPFKITVIPSKEEDDYYAVIVSMSHILGDGFTFYRIQNMLSADLPIAALQVERDHASVKKTHEEIVTDEGKFFESSAFLYWAIAGYIYKWFFGVKIESVYHEINLEAIAKEKKNTHGLPFVSTNDILTSWFFNVSKTDLGMMSINMRNRVKEQTDNMAGNYQQGILYLPPDFKDSGMIRKSLSNIHRASEPETSLPTPWQFCRSKFSMVTNWSSFSKPMVIPDSKEDLHIPIVDQQFSPAGYVGMIVFRFNGNRIAVNLAGASKDLKPLQDGGFLGSELK